VEKCDEIRRPLGIERVVERDDGIVLVLHPDQLAQPVAVGDLAGAAVAHPGQVFHLLGIGLGDVRGVEDQQRSRQPQPGRRQRFRITEPEFLGKVLPNEG